MPPSFPPFMKEFGQSIRHTKNADFSTRQLELQRKQKTKAKTNVAEKSFQQTSSFPKFSVKTSSEKTQQYKLQLHLQVSSCPIYQNFFDKNMIYLEI